MSSETRDRIAKNCLGIQLGDEEMAHDLYTDLRERLIRQPERRYDMDISVALTPWAHGPQSGEGAMFVTTIRGIRHVDVLTYNASSTPAAVSRLPASGPAPSVAVRVDGWVLPTAGVVFVWSLESEVASPTADGDRDVDLHGTSVRVQARKGR